MKFALLTLAFALAGTAVLQAKVIGKTVEYSADGISLKGYLAYDNSIIGKCPGIVVVHEWWGLTDYPKKRADMLAKLGYVAFAADMYGDGKTADNPTDAGKYAGESMKSMDTLKAKFLAALEILKKDEHVDPNRIAAIGYCYGGGVVLNMAGAGLNLKGVVSFHGTLGAVKPPEKGNVKAQILVCAGRADKFNSEKNIEAFKTEMKDAGAKVRYVSYKGAEHAFTNPDATALGKKFNLPIAYNKKADKESWAAMKMFFKKIFKS
jgi:dienelactone hydrolase